MAERLAPEQVPLRITSRPERARGRAGRWIRRTVATVLTLALLVVGTVATLHFLAVARSAQEVRATGLIPEEMPANVLVVLARPGQEVAMAGTLAALDDAGAEVHILSLTHGEQQPPAIEPGGDRVAEIRADELSAVGDVLGVEGVSVAEYGDGEVLLADPEAVTGTIAEAIEQVGASTVITVSDLTGEDADSKAVYLYTLNAAGADGSGVGRVWTVTRADREVSWNATLGEPIATEVPEADVAVRIDDQAMEKSRVLAAHGTQSPDLVSRTYPYADRIPSWAYFRFWDREYFTLGWGQPLP